MLVGYVLWLRAAGGSGRGVTLGQLVAELGKDQEIPVDAVVCKDTVSGCFKLLAACPRFVVVYGIW